MSKRNLSSEQLPEAEGIAEHVCLHRVASTLRKHFRGHPAKVLRTRTHTYTHAHTKTITLTNTATSKNRYLLITGNSHELKHD